MICIQILATRAENETRRCALNPNHIECVEFHEGQDATAHMVSGKSFYTQDSQSAAKLLVAAGA